jgi:cytosine deaminase
MSTFTNLDLLNVRLPLDNDTTLYRLSVKDGKWDTIEPQTAYTRLSDFISLEEWQPDGAQGYSLLNQIDLEGKMLLPGLVDAHMHLDKSFSLTSVGNVSGTLEEACINYGQAAPSFTKAEIKSRIMRSSMQALSFGTTHIRTHLDFNVKVHKDVCMNTIEAALEVKASLAPYMTLQLVPMCSFDELAPHELDIVEEAIRMGIDGLGGAPHLSPTPKAAIDATFKLAMKHGLFIDLHADESDDPSMRTIEYIAMQTKVLGMSGRVTVDHLCSLASMTDEDAERLIRLMADAGLKAVSLPAVNLYLQGRLDRFPARRGVTRLKELWNAGIPVAVASDNIHDPFHPFGRGDLVQIALISSYATHMGRPADLRTLLRMISDVPAAVLDLPKYGVKTGVPANFVIMDASTTEELFTMLPDRRWVYSYGKWARVAAKKTGWNDALLSSYWDQACDSASFHRKEQSLTSELA